MVVELRSPGDTLYFRADWQLSRNPSDTIKQTFGGCFIGWIPNPVWEYYGQFRHSCKWVMKNIKCLYKKKTIKKIPVWALTVCSKLCCCLPRHRHFTRNFAKTFEFWWSFDGGKCIVWVIFILFRLDSSLARNLNANENMIMFKDLLYSLSLARNVFILVPL